MLNSIDSREAARGANILVFVVPHQFLGRLLDQIQGVVQPETLAVFRDFKDAVYPFFESSTLFLECFVVLLF